MAILIRKSEVVVSLSLSMLHSVPILTVISKGVNEPAFFRAPFTPAFGENGQISGRVASRDLNVLENTRSLAPIRALKTARPH